jgi:hypothetical protein
MTLTDTYTGDDYEGQAVDVAVVAADGTPISEVLYPLGAPVLLQTIRFLGGPGFTGLQQMNHCRARLQVSCFAEWWLCSANPLRAWAGAESCLTSMKSWSVKVAARISTCGARKSAELP